MEDEEDEVDSSALSTSRRANRDVLSNLCDKIQSVQGLMNGHVRNIFNLEDFVEPIYEGENTGESDSQAPDKSLVEPRYRLLPKK